MADIFNFLINIIATIMQIVLYPLNQIFILAFPDISTRITETALNLSHLFDGLDWALGLIPGIVRTTLTLILSMEIAKHSAYITSHVIVKVWNLIQKIKFW